MDLCVFSITSDIEEIIRFRDYIFNFHVSVKCKEEDCDLKHFINKTDDNLMSKCSNTEKKNAFCTSLCRGPLNF